MFIMGIAAPAQSLPAEPLPGEFNALANLDAIKSDASELLGTVFTENMGQIGNAEVLFYASSGNIAFTRDSVLLYASATTGDNVTQAIRISFPGSNDVGPAGRDPAAWHSNYLSSGTPEFWNTGVTNYREVIYKDLWDGIDLVYRFENRSLKYDLIVAPYADHEAIRIKAEGQKVLSISPDGSLDFDLGGGRSVSDTGLRTFYGDGRNEALASSFELVGESTYSFSIPDRDMTRPLVIDPLIYSSFLGGSGNDYVTDVAVGSDGCAYVTGYSASLNFPTTYGAYQTSLFDIAPDSFVVKMSLNGDTVVYATYIGNSGGDYAQAIAVDSRGCAYITGYTMSWDYPVTKYAFQELYGGDTYDAFVTKLAPYGDSLVYSSYLGATSSEWGTAIAVDSFGFAYVLGDTWSDDFPITPNAFSRTMNGGIGGANDMFVTKFGQLGDAVAYSTFLGHNDNEKAGDIAVDSNGYAYVTGQTRSALFPVSTNAYDRSHNGGYDAIVLKIGQTGASLVFSTFLGGGSADNGCGIAVGLWGHVYVTGTTGSSDFPTTEGAADTELGGSGDAFVTMLGKYGEALGYSTYLGGSENDYAADIVIDAWGCAHVTGSTTSADYPVVSGSFGTAFNGAVDAFVTKMSQNGASFMRSDFLGGTDFDYSRAIAIGPGGYAYVAGDTFSADFPVTPGSLDETHNTLCDGFVAKLDIAPPSTAAGWDQWILEGETAVFDGSATADNHIIENYTWSFYDGTGVITLYGPTVQHTFILPGVYVITLNVTDVSGNWATDSKYLTVVDTTDPVAVGGPDQSVDEDTEVLFNGSSSSDNVGIVNYTWTFIEGTRTTVLYGPVPSFVFATPGVYSVRFKVTDAAGNAETDMLTVTVRDVTVPTAVAGPDQKVYQGTNVRFDALASRDNLEIVNYTWRFGDGVSQVAAYTPTLYHVFAVPGVYTATLTVRDAAAHYAQDSFNITVLETVTPVADAGSDFTANNAEYAAFDGSASSDNVGIVRWLWTFYDGINDASMSGAAPLWLFPLPGVFTVTLNVTDAAGNWATDTVTVTVLDTRMPIAEPGVNVLAFAGSPVEFNAIGSYDESGIASYTWSFTHNGTSAELSGANQSFVFWTPGTYTVMLTVEDPSGNVASENITVTVQQSTTGAVIETDDGSSSTMLLAGAILLVASAAVIFLGRRKGAVL